MPLRAHDFIESQRVLNNLQVASHYLTNRNMVLRKLFSFTTLIDFTMRQNGSQSKALYLPGQVHLPVTHFRQTINTTHASITEFLILALRTT